MATATGKSRCAACEKEKATSKCSGCLRDYCFNHLSEHRQELARQLDEIEVNRDLFYQTLLMQTSDSKRHVVLQEINQWEKESIERIQRIAQETRELTMKYTFENSNKIKDKLQQLTNEIKLSRQEDDITEIDLEKWKHQLEQLTEELNKPTEVIIRQSSTPIVTRITVNILDYNTNSKSSVANQPNIPIDSRWKQNGITIAGVNGRGTQLDQLSSSFGIAIDDDETLYIADQSNNRIIKWQKNARTGSIAAGGNGEGNRVNQLCLPKHVIIDYHTDTLIIADHGNKRVVRWSRRNPTYGEILISNVSCWGLAIDNASYLYVSDTDKYEVRRWTIGEQKSILVAGGNGKGNGLDQFNEPRYIYVDSEQSIYVSDCWNNRIMKWRKGAREGIVVAGENGRGIALNQLYYPHGIVVDQLGTLYIADFANHRVIRWLKDANEGSTIAGTGKDGNQSNQFSFVSQLAFDRENNLYAADLNNFRIQKFLID